MADLGEILRQHRERKGISLENAAFLVGERAAARNIDPKSKKIPRTHASLSRWETGKVEIKELGLELLAEAYGLTKETIRRPPPPDNEPPSRQINVPESQASAVEAFLEAIKKAG